jgi:fluoride exporter
MIWWQWLLVGLAGAVGAPLRYVVDTIISRRVEGAFPLGTLAVNVSGSFVLGLLSGLAIYHGLPGTPRLVLGTGLVGAYTTFSTFSLETVALVEEGETRLAAGNVVSNAFAGAAAAAAGLALAAL